MTRYFGYDRPYYVPRGSPLWRYWLRTSRNYAAACEHGDQRALLPHLTTLDTVEDMGAIRQALGAAKINYYGFSYGDLPRPGLCDAATPYSGALAVCRLFPSASLIAASVAPLTPARCPGSPALTTLWRAICAPARCGPGRGDARRPQPRDSTGEAS